MRIVGAGGSADGTLRPGDVVQRIGGYDIANNGTVRYGDRLRMGWPVILCERFVGDLLEVEGLRNGEPFRYERQNALKLDSSLESCSSKFPQTNFQINLRTKLQITNTHVLSLVFGI